MRVVIVGLGNQGKKRQRVAGHGDIATIVEPTSEYWYRDIEAVPLSSYDAALVCTPPEPKNDIVTYLLSCGKHVLVEKPFFPTTRICRLAETHKLVCYTAYNHRFESNVVSMQRLIGSGKLGKIHLCRMFYGFGTAAEVKDTWRDSGSGVVPEVCPHLIDLAMQWFGEDCPAFRRFTPSVLACEIGNPDYFSAFMPGDTDTPSFQMEGTWFSWKNTFTVDVFGSKGSAHINGLLKWGQTQLTTRMRMYPSGPPDEETTITEGSDRSWEEEYQFFKKLCGSRASSGSFLQRDRKIAAVLSQIEVARPWA